MIASMETEAAPSAKACPLCGQRKHLVMTNRDFFYGIREGTRNSAYIQCENCYLQMWFFDHSGVEMTYENVIRLMVRKWNQRADSHRTSKEKAVKQDV